MSVADAIFEGLDLNEIEIENEGFFIEGYEVEVYWDVKEWNDQGTDYTGRITWEGNAVSSQPHATQAGDIDYSAFAADIRKVINQGLKSEDRVGPIYVAC